MKNTNKELDPEEFIKFAREEYGIEVTFNPDEPPDLTFEDIFGSKLLSDGVMEVDDYRPAKDNKSYYVENIYIPGNEVCETVNYCHIGIASANDPSDEESYIGKEEFANFKVYDSLFEAIEKAGFIADKIEFIGFNEDELEEAKEIIDYLMHDDGYLKMFGREKDNDQNA